MKKTMINIAIFLLISSIGFFGGFLVSKLKATDKTEAPPPPSEGNSSKAENSIDEKNALAILEEKIRKDLAEYDGEWAVYVEDLTRGDAFEINNKKMVSASLIKLFIMGKVYEEIEHGTISEETVNSDLSSMITVSDNEASNRLVATLGGGTYTDMYQDAFQEGLTKVNSYAVDLACPDTEQQRDMKNARPTPIPEQNYTSVVDCGKLLSKLYHKSLVSKEADTAMLKLLKQQTRTGKIPAGLPEGIVSANKTGELSDVENDVAIVFSPGADYVICVMSNAVPDTSMARSHITHLSKTVYEFFN